MTRRLLPLLLILLAVPTASARLPSSIPDLGTGLADDPCNNHGNVVQVTVLGHNYYCVGKDCTNDGLILQVGPSSGCYGNGILVACSGEECVIAPNPIPYPGPMGILDSVDVSHEGNTWAPAEIGTSSVPCKSTVSLVCDGGGACGINQQPVCWTFRYACYAIPAAETAVTGDYNNSTRPGPVCYGHP